MPSFFEGLKRIAQGKPVFEPTGTPNDSPSQSGGPIEAPRVLIEQTESRANGDRMETYCHIRNDSEVEVFLDKIRLLGTTRELDTSLKARDRKELLVYSGEMPNHDNDHDAELQYRDLDGNYFKARHDVRFEPNGDRYTIVKMPYENTSRI